MMQYGRTWKAWVQEEEAKLGGREQQGSEARLWPQGTAQFLQQGPTLLKASQSTIRCPSVQIFEPMVDIS